MLYWTHWLVMGIYAAAPIVMTIYALVQASRDKARAAARLFVSVLIGSCLGIGATAAYSYFTNARIGTFQFFLAMYFATSVMLILNAFDSVIRKLSLRIAPRPSPERGAVQAVLAEMGQMSIGFLRALVLMAVGLPYILSVAVTYRPKVHVGGDPRSLLGVAYSPVSFQSTDGIRLSGWWIPAATRPSARPQRATTRPADFGNKTVILCHGFGANKSSQLSLVRALVPAGYNVLSFDFRAHGDSGGQITSMGDLERRDVLGAVRWARANHPEQTKRIVGVGASMGAAALIAAAVDPSDDGQAIEAIAVYDVYDDLKGLASDVSAQAFTSPIDRFTARIGLPLASLQTGTDLSRFSPATMVNDLWPRPILVVHGTHDLLVGFDRGVRLFDSATQPKQRLWLIGEDEKGAINDDVAAETVREFLDTAVPVQII